MEKDQFQKYYEFLKFLRKYDAPATMLFAPDSLKALIKLELENGNKRILEIFGKFVEAEKKFKLLRGNYDLSKLHPWLFGKELIEKAAKLILKYEFAYSPVSYTHLTLPTN